VVEVEGDMVAHGLNRLQPGLTYKGKELPPVKASWQNENRLRFAMKNPQPG
jgi:23S rRNA pseudouridine2604 synthase